MAEWVIGWETAQLVQKEVRKQETSNSKKDVMPFDAGKDSLKLKISEAIFILEGLTMYLNEKEIARLLKQIKKYKGQIVIDFFNKKNSTKEKS